MCIRDRELTTNPEALEKIAREKYLMRLFEKYRRRFHPYCSVASLYLWAVAGGAIPEMKDYKPKSKSGK